MISVGPILTGKSSSLPIVARAIAARCSTLQLPGRTITTITYRTIINPHFGWRTTLLDHSLTRRCDSLLADRRQFSYVSWVSSIAFSSPVLYVQESLLNLHQATGWPWWAVIVAATFGARILVTLPLTVYQNKILARYARLQPEIKALAQELKGETLVAIQRFGWSKSQARKAFNLSLRKQIRLLIERDNCHPFKASIVVWIQIPMWISISFSLRNLVSMMPYQDLASQLTFLELLSGGILWIPNLTIPDYSLLLPFTLGFLNLVIVEMHASRTLARTRFQKIITNFMRVMSIVMVPIAATVPSCLALYWTTSSCLGLVQNLLTMSPAVRRFCRIPSVDGESKTPYRDLANNFQTKLSNITTRVRWTKV